MDYFRSFTNWLDFFIVVLTILELYVFAALEMEFPNVTFIRLIRLAKLTKALRVVRVMHFFQPLRVLTISIVSSMPALGWSVVFLSVVQVICAIGMAQMMGDAIADEGRPRELRESVFRHFGRWSSAMLTMLEITIAPGAW